MTFIPNEIKKIVDKMTLTGVINSISEVGGYSFIETDYFEIGDLKIGMIINMNDINYEILDISLNILKVEAINLIATNWTLAVNFLSGEYLEVQGLLSNMDGDNSTKFKIFPLIWLVLDIKEKKEVSSLIESEASIVLVFAAATNFEKTAIERQNENFKKIITPLLDLFMKTLNNPLFNNILVKGYGEKIKYDEVKRYLYKKSNKKSVFKTLTDAIEIEVHLKFRKKFLNCK